MQKVILFKSYAFEREFSVSVRIIFLDIKASAEDVQICLGNCLEYDC